MNNLQAASHESAPTAFARFKSTLSRLVGAKPVEEPKPKTEEVVWSEEWCAKEPEAAALAIAALKEKVKSLTSQLNAKESRPRKHRVSINSKGVYLSSVPPSTYFKVLRNGEVFRTSDQGWRLIFSHETDMPTRISGITRVLILHSKPD